MGADKSTKALFSEALDRPAAERDVFLASACAGDPALRAKLERLLAANRERGEFLALPTDGSPPAWAGPALEGAGDSIGAYKLLQEIGEGGFGVVFMAEQTAPVSRRVALKIIKAGMDTRQVIARFEAERQALAMMDHPGIARVFDAGATAAGRPFFVMELVRGEPVTSYCDARDMAVRGRLELFQQVCHAVQHAHQKGIIHRDIKPSNILVAEIDGHATPKIIDFGIAKATGSAGGTATQLTDKTLFTDFRQFIGTPEYMSPEQAGMDGIDVDTRSDIYSLGVLLYELLTGGPPFDPQRLRSAEWDEMRRIIREDEAQRPSTRLHSQQAAAEIAARRRTEPARLIGLVRGDLDWVVMRCLEKDRSRRYETASALAMDIARHIGGEPVLAAPPSRTYRVRKFVHRHRARVVAGSLVAASLVGAIVGATVFALGAAHQRGIAEQHAEETREIADFQSEMLSGIEVALMGERLRSDLLDQVDETSRRAGLDPADLDSQRERLGRLLEGANFTTAILRNVDEHIFARATNAIEERFAGRPQLKARLLQDVADTLRTLGFYERALAAQTEALDVRRHALTDDHPDTLASTASMAQLLADAMKPNDAEAYARRAYEGRRRVLGDEHQDTLSSASLLAFVLWRQYRFAEAESIQWWALERRKRLFGEQHPDTIESIIRVGQVLFQQNRLSEAEDYYEQARDAADRFLEPDHDLSVLSLSTLAALRNRQGKIEEARALWTEALERRRRTKGDDNRNAMFIRCKLGSLLVQENRLDEAESEVSDLLERRRRVLGEDNMDTLESLRVLGWLRQRQGRLADSERAYRQALEGLRRTQGPAHPETLKCACDLASLLDQMSDPTGAIEIRMAYVREAMDAFRAWQGEWDYHGLGFPFHVLLRHVDDGGALRAACIDAHTAKYGAADSRTLQFVDALARHLTDVGRDAEARLLPRHASSVHSDQSDTSPQQAPRRGR